MTSLRSSSGLSEVPAASNPESGLPQKSSLKVDAAFTLIELTLVVFIIGILLSLVLSATAKGGSAAKNARCLGNLRQLGIALRLYAEADSGHLPSVDPARFATNEFVDFDGLEKLPFELFHCSLDTT